MFIFSLDIWETKNPWSFSMIMLFSLLPAIAIFSPTIKLVYAAFGLTFETGGAVILLGLFLGLLLPVFRSAHTSNRFLVPIAALVCCIVALVLAHLDFNFTEEHPLQSNVRYLLDGDEKKAYWTSDFGTTDDWSKQFFNDARVGNNGGLLSEAPLLPLAPPSATLKKDTVEDDVRQLSLHVQSNREAIMMWIVLDNENPATKIKINNEDGERINFETSEGPIKNVEFAGLTNDGFDVLFEVTPGMPFEITLIDRSLELPEIMGYSHYPANILPGTGWNSNTTQVKKRFVF